MVAMPRHRAMSPDRDFMSAPVNVIVYLGTLLQFLHIASCLHLDNGEYVGSRYRTAKIKRVCTSI